MVDNTNVGDEGGFAPNLKNAEEAIKLIIDAIRKIWLKTRRFVYLFRCCCK